MFYGEFIFKVYIVCTQANKTQATVKQLMRPKYGKDGNIKRSKAKMSTQKCSQYVH